MKRKTGYIDIPSCLGLGYSIVINILFFFSVLFTIESMEVQLASVTTIKNEIKLKKYIAYTSTVIVQ
jgi:hypothetical protein